MSIMGENNLVLHFEGGPMEQQTITVPAGAFKAIMDAPILGTNLTAVYRAVGNLEETGTNYRIMRLFRYTSPERNYLPDFHRAFGVGIEDTLKTLRALKKMASDETHASQIGLAIEIISGLKKNADGLFTIGGFDSYEACKMMAEATEDADI